MKLIKLIDYLLAKVIVSVEGDGDSGEDKMSVASKRENKSSYEIAKYYTDCFFDDCCKLNIRKPDVVSNATDNIDMYIKMITKLLDEAKIDYKYIDDVFSLMGDVYMRLKEYNNADIAYSAAVHYYASSPRWWYKLGYARELAGSRGAAVKAYDRALALNPSYKDALEGKARTGN